MDHERFRDWLSPVDELTAAFDIPHERINASTSERLRVATRRNCLGSLKKRSTRLRRQ